MKAMVPETTLVRLTSEDCGAGDWFAVDLAETERKTRVKRVKRVGKEESARMTEGGVEVIKECCSATQR